MTNANRALLLAGLSTLALATPAGAQINPQAQQNAEAQAQATTNEQTIVVTGTHVSGSSRNAAISVIECSVVPM